MRLLEVGCGPGTITLDLAARVAPVGRPDGRRALADQAVEYGPAEFSAVRYRWLRSTDSWWPWVYVSPTGAYVITYRCIGQACAGSRRRLGGQAPAALVAEGHVSRTDHTDDRRSVKLTLTPAGRRMARRILAARREAVVNTLEGLSEQERRSLMRLAEALTAQLVDLRLTERDRGNAASSGWLCRLCDFGACGRRDGLCPAAERARARTTQRGGIDRPSSA